MCLCDVRSAEIWRFDLAKGIRVNQLAKELGVESKAILAKCREEGLGDKVPNHMSVLTAGLAETVREWFSGGGGGTAVEVAAPVEVKPKKPRVRKRVDASEHPDENGQESHEGHDAHEPHEAMADHDRASGDEGAPQAQARTESETASDSTATSAEVAHA